MHQCRRADRICRTCWRSVPPPRRPINPEPCRRVRPGGVSQFLPRPAEALRKGRPVPRPEGRYRRGWGSATKQKRPEEIQQAWEKLECPTAFQDSRSAEPAELASAPVARVVRAMVEPETTRDAAPA